MKFERNPYFTVVEKINLLQRWIIIHSIIYYKMGASIVTDAMFDDNCKQLVRMMRDYPEDLKQSRYYYVMHDFEGSTGFDLPEKLKKEDANILFPIAMTLVGRING